MDVAADGASVWLCSASQGKLVYCVHDDPAAGETDYFKGETVTAARDTGTRQPW